MKKQKMSLEKMRGVLSNVLSRAEMKEVMAGSGPNNACLTNYICPVTNPNDPGDHRCESRPGTGACQCVWKPDQLCG